MPTTTLDPRRWIALVLLCASFFMVVLDTAIVVVAMPSIESDLGFLYGTILTGPSEDPAHHSRNICVFASAEVDRSPTGTGVSGRVAQLHARGELALGEEITVESILGRSSVFRGRAVETTSVGPHQAVIPEVSGTAFMTGRSEFVVDPRDTLGGGFLLGVRS